MVRSLFALLFILIWTEGALAKPSSDFNSDGVTDFADYVLFAGHVGSAQGEPGFDSRFDLDNNGTIDLGDFELFAEVFGQGEFISKKALTPEELEALAKAYMTAGNWEAAERIYKSIIKAEDTPLATAKGMKKLGELYVKTDSLEKAETQFTKALGKYGDSKDYPIRLQMAGISAYLAVVKHKQGGKGSKYYTFKYLEKARSYFPPLPTE